MSEGHDVVIRDEAYLEEGGTLLEQECSRLSEILDTYISVLCNIRSSAIIEGATAETLETFIRYVEPMANLVNEIGLVINRTTINFIGRVDDADEYLYGEA